MSVLHRRSLWRVYVVVCLSMIAITIGMLLVLLGGKRVYSRYAPLIGATLAAELEITSAHLALAEGRKIVHTVRFEDVSRHLDRAERHVQSMLHEGAGSDGAFELIDDPDLRRSIDNLHGRMTDFHRLSAQLWEESHADPPTERGADSYHAAFRDLLQILDHLEIELNNVVEREISALTRLQIGLIIGSVLLCALLALVFGRHIRAHEKAREAVKASEDRFRTIVETAPSMLQITDAEGKNVYISPNCEDITGYTQEELQGAARWWVHEDDTPAAREVFDQALRNGIGGRDYEYSAVRKDGAVWCASSSWEPIRGDRGQLLGCLWQTIDITDRKHAENQRLEYLHYLQYMEQINEVIRKSDDLEQINRDVVHTVFSIFNCDRAWLLYPCDPHSPTWTIPIECTRPEYPGQNATGGEVPMTEEIARNFAEALDSKEPIVRDPSTSPPQEEIARAYGVQSLMYIAIHPRVGKPWLLGVHQCSHARVWTAEERRLLRDISHRIADALSHLLLFQNLQASEERLRTLINATPDIVCFKDGQGRWLVANEADLALFDLTGVDYHGRTDAELADHSPFHRDAFLTCESTDEIAWNSDTVSRGEEVIPRSDGTTKVFDVIKVPLFHQDGRRKGLVVLGRDITERKLAEEELLKERDFSKTLVETSPTFFVAIDAQGRTLMMNQAMLRALGYTLEEVQGRDYLSQFIPEEDRAMLADIFARLISASEPTVNENRILTRSGQELLVEWHGRQVLDAAGRTSYFFGVGIDVTLRKKAEEERRKLETRIQHAQKLESLGILAGGIAHDFNNLLVGILGHAGLAQMDLPPESPVRATILRIETAAQRAADLATQMLAYSGKGRFLVEPLNISKLVEEMVHLLEVSISKKANMRFELAHDLPLIEADATQVRQVVMNLMTNASDALADRSGVIAVRTGVMEADRKYFADSYLDEDLEEGYYVYVEVSDTGCGMDQQTLARIFDPFFTTKFTGRGLGLAAVLGIVRGHRGMLKVTSKPGRGSTFRVLFPCRRDSGNAATHYPGDTAVESTELHGDETILMADDEEIVRTVAKMTLEKYGYTVLMANDGREAVDLFRERADDIAVVLLDMTMPVLSGEEALREIRAIRGDVPVILSSGYNEQEATNRFAGAAFTTFIQKPYRPHDLLQRLRAVLQK